MEEIILATGPGVLLSNIIISEDIDGEKIKKLAREWRNLGITYAVIDDAQSKNAGIINAFLLAGIQIWVNYTTAPEPVILRRLKDSGVSVVMVPAEKIEVAPSTVKRVTRNGLACIIKQDPRVGMIYDKYSASILFKAGAHGIYSTFETADDGKYFLAEGLNYYITAPSALKELKKISGHGILSIFTGVDTNLVINAWKGDVVAQNNLIELNEKSYQTTLKTLADRLSK